MRMGEKNQEVLPISLAVLHPESTEFLLIEILYPRCLWDEYLG